MNKSVGAKRFAVRNRPCAAQPFSPKMQTRHLVHIISSSQVKDLSFIVLRSAMAQRRGNCPRIWHVNGNGGSLCNRQVSALLVVKSYTLLMLGYSAEFRPAIASNPPLWAWITMGVNRDYWYAHLPLVSLEFAFMTSRIWDCLPERPISSQRWVCWISCTDLGSPRR